MDRQLSELPNRFSTQDLTHRSRAIHGQSPSPEIQREKTAKLSTKVRPVDKGLTTKSFIIIHSL